ncbi:hypothetical protein AVEN_215225-1 [Araneus ventricosus]|uniref:Uncharacterized protein n=1 Tax=Araneus ventricosus TaxID=182803 RepID=A0A4Y2J9P1_ARAVE|nr:hypothetical protein AVEN_202802-1 [Araneus ventricosus]GBM86861.1 hypothetical protein AVEN_215225-1 [Araneus ventricosus]
MIRRLITSFHRFSLVFAFACQFLLEFRADQVCGRMKSRHLKCLAYFGDPPDGNVDVRESVYLYIYKGNIVQEHLTGPQHYLDNGLVSGSRGEVSRNQEEDGYMKMLMI